MAKENKKPKVLFGQNMTARMKSPLFWTGIVGIVGSAVVSFGSLIGMDLSDQVDKVTEGSSQLVEFVFLILGLIGVSVDPTSKRYRDSEHAQEYKKPRDDKDPREYVQWMENGGKPEMTEDKKTEDKQEDNIVPERKEIEQKEYDTSQPFSDDSDEVEYDVAEYEYDEEIQLGASRFHDDEALKDGKEDESHEEDFVENIDNVSLDEEDDDKKVVEETVKETKIVKEKDEKESDK